MTINLKAPLQVMTDEIGRTAMQVWREATNHGLRSGKPAKDAVDGADEVLLAFIGRFGNKVGPWVAVGTVIRLHGYPTIDGKIVAVKAPNDDTYRLGRASGYSAADGVHQAGDMIGVTYLEKQDGDNDEPWVLCSLCTVQADIPVVTWKE